MGGHRAPARSRGESPLPGSTPRPPLGAARCALLLVALLLLGTGACRRFTKEGADREVYGILDQARPRVPEIVGTLHVDAADAVADARRARKSYRLMLKDALALAAAASRDYRSQRETVYLAALDLTTARNKYRPIFGASGTGELQAEPGGSRGHLSGDLSASRALETGGSLVLDLATDFLRNLTSPDPFRLAQTLLSADLVLPLVRGSGWVARENLTQAERDTLYAMRSFARYQQEFTVDIASSYFRLLQLRDTWENEELTYESLKRLLARQEALGAQAAGRIPDFEVDQARQDLLQADERRLSARINYASGVDRFKLDLGIPVTVEVTVPKDDLDRLRAEGPLPPPISEEKALEIARDRRLDLVNARDQEVDAWRKVLVAKNGLGTQLDLHLGGELQTPGRRPFDLTDAQVNGLLGLDLDLPVERTAERNAFRAAIIRAAQARRLRQGREDQVDLDVREAYRRLEEARRSYEIQDAGVKLAERRVESTTLLLEAGQASTRDRLEAEDALVRARNARTGALVDHAVAHLQLERDIGTLQVDENAAWVEPPVEAPPAAKTTPAPAANDHASDRAADPPTGGVPDPLGSQAPTEGSSSREQG